MTSQEGGGFLHPTLPTPPASVASPQPRITLPQPRTTPLKPGGTKESNFINYVEGRLLAISGRYERRGEEAGNTPAGRARSAVAGKPGAPAAGYHNFAEVAVDLEGAVDVVWVSGTPSLQIPFLLNIALAVTSYLPSFPFSPRRTFQLLQKLDLAFVSLLQGRNAETGEELPGFDGGKAVSTTEKVRIRGIVESTRVLVVNISRSGGSLASESVTEETETETEGEMDVDTETDVESMGHHEDHGRGDGDWEMEVARVYERTVVELGNALNDGTGLVG